MASTAVEFEPNNRLSRGKIEQSTNGRGVGGSCRQLLNISCLLVSQVAFLILLVVVFVHVLLPKQLESTNSSPGLVKGTAVSDTPARDTPTRDTPTRDTSTSDTPHRDTPARDTPAQNRCSDVMKEMQSGKWQLRRDLRPEDFQHRTYEDIRIRKLRGLPITLHRGDLRCGNKFPLDYQDFPNIPAFCDPHSRAAPCCNHKSGWCGSGQQNCSCNSCSDYRNTVAAELSDFVSSSGCQFKNFTSKQACQLLSERISSLSLIGDSLVRHFHNAMLILLTGDNETGCLRKNLGESDKQSCSGEMQFVDSGKTNCHFHTARKLSQLPKGAFCEGRHKFSYTFHEFYSSSFANSALNEVRAHLHQNNTVVAIGVGFHMGFNTEQVQNGYLKPILQLKEREKSHWPLIVWLNMHAAGSLKPIQFFPSRNSEAIGRFNMAMREYLEPIGVPIFDTFNLTLRVHSYDGLHYGFGVNMVKAQLFLNFLDQTFSKR